MPATLTATPMPNASPPRVQLVVAGMAGATVTITRTNTDGSAYVVRTANPGALATAAFFDYESPWRQGGTYTATSDTGDTAPATVPSLTSLGLSAAMLLHVGAPALSVPIVVAGRGDRTHEVNQGVHQVLGRDTTITRSDGRRRKPSFDLVIRTSSVAQEDALRALVADVSTVLLQIAVSNAKRSVYQYVSIGAITEADLVPSLESDEVHWTLPCSPSASPTGLLQPQWTCAGVLAAYATVAQVRAKYATCTDLLINHPAA